MKIQGIAIVSLVALAGCPKGGAPKANVNDCADVEAHAVQLFSSVAPSRDAGAGRDLFAQPAAPSDEDRQATMQEYARLEGKAWRSDCDGNAWTQAQIDCYLAAPTVDDGKACVSGAAPVAAEPDDPACVAAAEHGAEILANDIGVTGEDREDVLRRAVPAILEPCLALRFSDELLECLTDPEMTESFGICSFAEGEGWERLDASLRAEGFGPGED